LKIYEIAEKSARICSLYNMYLFDIIMNNRFCDDNGLKKWQAGYKDIFLYFVKELIGQIHFDQAIIMKSSFINFIEYELIRRFHNG